MTPTKYTDIAIIGGGLAGSTAAAMLGRAWHFGRADRPASGPSAGFSRRKAQWRRTSRPFCQNRHRRFGPAISTHSGEDWIARSGYLLDKRPSRQFGMMYDQFVNTIRALPAWLPPTAWTAARSRRSTTIPSKGPATPGHRRKRIISAR
jgi:glycine/D-amino acid oxidase-like deaminating enzyme